MKHFYELEAAKQKKFSQEHHEKSHARQLANQAMGIATRYTDTQRDDKKDHTPMYRAG